MNINLGDTKYIIDECLSQGLLRNETAYVLATAYWETAKTMKPVREYGGEKYLKSKKYYPFVGMGYVQITWKVNYKKASDKLGINFVRSPKKLLEKAFAVQVLIRGMKEGWFTGVKLSDFITLRKSDFVKARKIVNGTDKAKVIARIALNYDVMLLGIGYGIDFQIKPSKKPTEPRTESSSRNIVLTIIGIIAAAVAAYFGV